jgi:hypothetical protein
MAATGGAPGSGLIEGVIWILKNGGFTPSLFVLAGRKPLQKIGATTKQDKIYFGNENKNGFQRVLKAVFI